MSSCNILLCWWFKLYCPPRPNAGIKSEKLFNVQKIFLLHFDFDWILRLLVQFDWILRLFDVRRYVYCCEVLLIYSVDSIELDLVYFNTSSIFNLLDWRILWFFCSHIGPVGSLWLMIRTFDHWIINDYWIYFESQRLWFTALTRLDLAEGLWISLKVFVSLVLKI